MARNEVVKFTLSGKAYFRTPDAAILLNRSIYTVQKWCRQGRFDGAKKLGRDYVIPETSISSMKERLKVDTELKETTLR